MPSKEILIHVGVAKAASSWLQKELFSRSELGFLYDDSKRLDFYQHILPQHSPYYSQEDCYRHIKKELLDEAHEKGLLPVWSNELLSGWPSYGSYNRELLAQRIEALFPNARILLVIREQKAAIKSIYGQYIREGGTMNIQTYMTQNWVAPYFHGFNLMQYDYHQMLCLYRELFGKDNVFCIPFELLKEDPVDFTGRISNFLELGLHKESFHFSNQVNRSPSASFLWMKRHLGKLISNRRSVSNQNALFYANMVSRLWPLMKMPGFVDRRIDQKLTAKISDMVQDEFRNSNASLQQEIDIDLKSFGYDV